ncbi:hypothetical protein TYRP_011616 [Tyrophagus putrescentiae]|nr:hypothetical protein TYRP_011616 [Tyrophagus putrescentiae]
MDIIIIRQPIPYKSLDSMVQYLQTHLVQHLLLLLFEPPSTSLKLLTGDLARLTHLPPAVNLVLAGSLAMAAYCLHVNYFDERTHLTRDFFAELLDSSGFHFFVLISQYYGIKAVLQLPALSPALKVATLAIAELNIVTLYAALYIFSLTHMLLGTMGITLMRAASLLMKQLELRLLQMAAVPAGAEATSTATTNGHHPTFRREYVQMVLFLSTGNRRFLAQTLLPMLLVNCPSTALLITTLLNYGQFPLHPLVQLLVVMVLGEQFLCIFISHLMQANVNGQLRTLARRFISLVYSDDGGRGGGRGAGAGRQLYTSGAKRSDCAVASFWSGFTLKSPMVLATPLLGASLVLTLSSFFYFIRSCLMFIYQTNF